MLVKEFGVLKVMSLLVKAGSGLGFSFGVRVWTEMEIWCVKDMKTLKCKSPTFKSPFSFHLGYSNILGK